MPNNCPFFMDPRRVIDKYKLCPLHPSKSGLLGLGLAEVWCYCNGETELDGAHNAMTDVKAQMDVVNDERFWNFIDKNQGWELLENIWAAKRAKMTKERQETVRKLPVGWDDWENIKSWTLHDKKSFTSSEGGPVGGPSTKVMDAINNTGDDKRDKLVKLFQFFFTSKLLSNIARETNRYGNEDWVKPQQSTVAAIDGDKKKKVILIPCKSNEEGARHFYWTFDGVIHAMSSS